MKINFSKELMDNIFVVARKTNKSHVAVITEILNSHFKNTNEGINNDTTKSN